MSVTIKLDADCCPWVTLDVRAGEGSLVAQTKFLFDTGFGRELAMDADTIAKLGLAFVEEIEVFNTAGARKTKTYKGEVKWDGKFRPVEVMESQRFLVGAKLMRGHRIKGKFVAHAYLVLESL